MSSALSIRISDQDRQLIDQAAAAASKTRTQFMIDSARDAAVNALSDQRIFLLKDDEFKAFEEALNKAPTVSSLIEKLSKRPSPWKA